MGTRWDQAHVAVRLATVGVVVANREQSGVLALRSGIGLQGDLVVAGDPGQPVLQVGNHPAHAG